MIDVEFLDSMGSDLDVVNAARVSFAKESELEVVKEYIDGYQELKLSDKDAKLINYLAKHKHKSPFNHAFAKFRVKAPIFVARQLVKHEYLVWNEVSRRYVDDEVSFYRPENWRKKAEDKKQGSGDNLEQGHRLYWKNAYMDDIEYLTEFYDHCLATYKGLLEQGVAPEQARMVLPLSTMTEWIWSGSLYAFAKMVALRTTPDAQYESRIVADKISKTMSEIFPVSWEALKGNVL